MKKTTLQLPILLWALLTAPLTSADGAAAGRYAIDAGQSQILLYTGRAGWLALLGHNHVLAARQISGEVLLTADPARSSARLVIPVAAIEVDAADLRAAAGEGFDSEPSSADIDGTRRNMLGPGQLDAAQHPEIRVRITVADWRPPRVDLLAELVVVGNTSSIAVPARVEITPGSLRISGETWLDQSALGITPFEAVGGGIRVADGVRVRFQITAKALP